MEDGLDRRTDRPDGSGGGSPTVVASRALGDDLMDGDQDMQPSDIMAPPRKPAARPAPAKTAPPDDAVSERTAGDGPQANGAPASGKGTEETSSNGASANRSPAAAYATLVVGGPPPPADTNRPYSPDCAATTLLNDAP